MSLPGVDLLRDVGGAWTGDSHLWVWPLRQEVLRAPEGLVLGSELPGGSKESPLNVSTPRVPATPHPRGRVWDRVLRTGVAAPSRERGGSPCGGLRAGRDGLACGFLPTFRGLLREPRYLVPAKGGKQERPLAPQPREKLGGRACRGAELAYSGRGLTTPEPHHRPQGGDPLCGNMWICAKKRSPPVLR